MSSYVDRGPDNAIIRTFGKQQRLNQERLENDHPDMRVFEKHHGKFVLRDEDGRICGAFTSRQDEHDWEFLPDHHPELKAFVERPELTKEQSLANKAKARAFAEAQQQQRKAVAEQDKLRKP